MLEALGYAFESLCYKHARSSKRQGAPVDLLLERRNEVIHLCEMKFVGEPFVVTRAYAQLLKEEVQLFEEHAKVRGRIIVTRVAPFGLHENTWSKDLVELVVDGKALMGN